MQNFIKLSKKGTLVFYLLMTITLIIMFGGIMLSPAHAGTDGSNNSPETAFTLFPGQQVSNSIDYKGDQDWFKISVDHTCSLVANITNNSGYVNYDLYDASLQKLYSNVFYSSAIYGWKVSPGIYYIKLSDYSNINYLTSNITMKVALVNEYGFLATLGQRFFSFNCNDPVNVATGKLHL